MLLHSALQHSEAFQDLLEFGRVQLGKPLSAAHRKKLIRGGKKLRRINNYIFPDETPPTFLCPPPVMKSHEIKLLECTPGLGSTGTNRRAFARALAWTHGARI